MRVVEGTATVGDIEAFVERLSGVGDDHGATVQAFDARYVVDREHLRRAVELADRAIERGENVARDRAVEILCYAAGRRQINRALEMGVSEGTSPVVVVVDAGPTAASVDDDEDGDPAGTARRRAAAERAAAADVATLLEPAATLGEYDPDRVRSFFDVTDAELDATTGSLADVVHERVALLAVEK